MPANRPSSSKATATDDAAVFAGEPDQVGQVHLAGRGRRRQLADPATQPPGIERVQPRVDLGGGQFVGTGVACLDDLLDRAELAADDTTERRRLSREHAGQGDRRVIVAPGLQDRVEIRAGHERHVARQDQDLDRVGRDDGQGGAPARARCLGGRPGGRCPPGPRPRRGPRRPPAR